MPEVTITYKNSKTLDALRDLSKYLDFVISMPAKQETKKGAIDVNGIVMTREGGAIDEAEMSEVFTRNNFNAKELRDKWQRTK
jgi:hypothetical protein